MKTYKGSIYAYSRPDKAIWPIKFSTPVMEKSKFNTTSNQKPANPSAAHACALIRMLFPKESKMGMAFSNARN